MPCGTKNMRNVSYMARRMRIDTWFIPATSPIIVAHRQVAVVVQQRELARRVGQAGNYTTEESRYFAFREDEPPHREQLERAGVVVVFVAEFAPDIASFL